MLKLWDWLNEVSYKKSPWSSFSEEDKKNFNVFMINRYISMYEPYCELVNFMQKIPYTEKEQYYKIYCEFLPKKKMFFKYIKSKVEKNKDDTLLFLSQYWECSKEEANDYLNLLSKEEINHILTNFGEIEKKKIKKKK